MKKLIEFYFRHKKICIIAVLLCVTTALLVVPNIAFAQAEDDINKLIRDINTIFDQLLRISSMWMWPIVLMCGSLLDNDLIFGGAMGERLLNVWVEIRNLVNIIFVLVLVAIAIYNVLGLGEEGGGLPLAFKTAIPKFVLALLAVNFSFLAAKVVLDFTNTLTGVVFALPTTTGIESTDAMQNKVENYICGTDSSETPGAPLWCDQGKFNAKAKSFFNKLDRNNITLVYALRFGHAVQLKFIKEGLKDVGQLTFNVIFNALLYVVYAVSFIVLLVVLLGRIIVLWIGVVLSPVIALTIVLPNLKDLAGEGGNIKDLFVQNAIAPLKIGLVLSVGYIMLDGLEADKGLHGDILNNTLTAIDPNSLPTDITDLQQLMIAVAMVVIVWAGVFAAAEKSVAKGITGFIKTNMEGFGKWVAKLPTYAQILPVRGKKEGKSLQQLWGGIKQPFVDIQRKGSYQDSYMNALALKQHAESGDVAGFTGKLGQDPTALKTAEGLAGLITLLQKSESEKAKQLANAIRGKGPDKIGEIVSEIYNQDKYGGDPVVEGIKGALGSTTDAKLALTRINYVPPTAAASEKAAETKEDEKKPEGGQKPDEVRAQLLDKTQDAKTVATAQGWTEDAVTQLRTLNKGVADVLLQGSTVPILNITQVNSVRNLAGTTAANANNLAKAAVSTGLNPDVVGRVIEAIPDSQLNQPQKEAAKRYMRQP